MLSVVIEAALGIIVIIIASAAGYIVKGFDKKLDRQSDRTGELGKELSDLRTSQGILEQRVTNNEEALSGINKDIENLEKRNQDLMDKLEKNQEKLFLAMGKMELEYGKLTMQFKQADITHADIKGDLARITAHLLGDPNTK